MVLKRRKKRDRAKPAARHKKTDELAYRRAIKELKQWILTQR